MYYYIVNRQGRIDRYDKMEEKIKNIFVVMGIILGIAFCIFLLNVVESRENERAEIEGRNTLIYASNGEKYYK